MPSKSCGTCGFGTLHPQVCQRIGYDYSTNRNQLCPFWVKELPKCDICGQIDLKANIFIKCTDGSYKRLCENCANSLSTCRSCSNGTTCDFETNPSPLPKTVQKRIQQGNQIIVTAVKSEERVAETCAKNCICYDKEQKFCRREQNYCGNYTDNYYKEEEIVEVNNG